MRYELLVGLRYTRAKRRNRFIGVNSLVSMIGIAVGVWALIVVLSVMNGFQKEVRTRILGVVSHVQISGPGNLLPDWQAVAQAATQNPRVMAAAPFVQGQAMLSAGRAVRGALVRGIEPGMEERVADFSRHMRAGSLADLKPGEFGIVLGVELARSLGVAEGDKVTIVAPGGQVTPAGVVPRLKQFTVVGRFDAGHYEYDSALALIHLDDAARLFRVEGPTGVQVKLADVQRARQVADVLAADLGPTVAVRDWTRTNRNWFDAVQIEKRLMFIILTLIVAVAAFNLVSTLVMTVTDKQADIAILRTLGASPRSIMGIFMVQGAAAGVIGTLGGCALGLVVAFNIDVIVPAIERALHTSFLPSSVYLISRMPSDPQRGDIVPIVVISLVLAFLATLYPSWRASRVQPAQALRYE
jgi:lipoprotein-releasing system permease protein